MIFNVWLYSKVIEYVCSVVAIAFQFSFLIVTSRDMDNYAHSKLGVKAENDIAMVSRSSNPRTCLVWKAYTRYCFQAEISQMPAACRHCSFPMEIWKSSMACGERESSEIRVRHGICDLNPGSMSNRILWAIGAGMSMSLKTFDVQAPGYAWNCGTSAAFLWLLAAIFNACELFPFLWAQIISYCPQFNTHGSMELI